MIASPAATPTEIILGVVKGNWSSWHQALKQLCFTKFGEAGQQILSNARIPLYPFATEPTKDDLLTDPTGTPIPGAFIYSRRSLTLADAATVQPTDETPIPFSTQGNTKLRDDRKILGDSKRRSSDHDTECLDHLYRHISVVSHTSLKTHVGYPTYSSYLLLLRNATRHLLNRQCSNKTTLHPPLRQRRNCYMDTIVYYKWLQRGT